MTKTSWNRWYRHWAAHVVLVLGLTLTLMTWYFAYQIQQAREQQRFHNAVSMARRTLGQELERYFDLLRAARGFWYGSTEVDREEWRIYVESLNLAQHAPGIQGIGFARRVSAGELMDHVAAVQAEGFPHYHVEPPGKRDVYFPIVFLEPFEGRNLHAFGYDMFSQPTRRAAMEAAALSGEITATPKVTLRQEKGPDQQAGFLVYLPVYRRGFPIDTSEQRSLALEGFIYSPYRMGDLVHGILGPRNDLSTLRLRIFDGPEENASLLFDSGQGPPAGSLREEHLSLTAAGRSWTLDFYAAGSFQSKEERQLPTLVLLLGLLSSWLVCGMVWLQTRGRLRSERTTAELRHSQEALRASELRYRLKIEQSPLAIQIFASDGRTIYVNRSWENLWGVTLADLEGYNVLKDPELERLGIQDQVRRVFDGQTVVIAPVLYSARPLANGKCSQARWVRTVIYPITDDLGRVREVVLMHEDFTQRKLAEEELRRAKEEAEAANRAKDQFLAVLSHELRNPLAPVLAMVNMLQREDGKGADVRLALEVIQRNVELEARLIDDLLDVTRITRGKLHLDLEPTDAHMALRHALEICAVEIENKHLQVTFRMEAAEHFVQADPARLQQVFWNLIKNAVKFTPAGGHIDIWTDNQPADATEKGAANGNARPALRIFVRDNGIGIPPEALARVFRPFEQADQEITRRFGGLGLGLTISKALVDAHHGELKVESPGTGKGATFSVALPTIARPAASDGASSPSAPRETAHPLRVLVVEDQNDTRRAMQLLLQRTGHMVQSAGSVQEALRLAEQNEFDVLVSDLGLPDGSGLDVVRAIRARYPQIRAIALSGLGMEEDVQRAREAGFDHHLTKPIQFARLQSLLEEVPSH